MSSVIGIIQARMGSSRLPGKILAPLHGVPLLAVLVERLRDAQVDEWWLATTREREDDLTASWGEELGLRVQRGSRDDVLSRFTEIARERRPDWILRVTADDPFCDAHSADLLIEQARVLDKDESPIALVGFEDGALPLGYGLGLARARNVVASEHAIPVGEPHHRSHVLSWLAAHAPLLEAPIPDDWPRRPDWRWTVDTPKDLAMARAAFERFGSDWRDIRYPEMVAALDAEPAIPALNRDVRQKALEES